MALDYGPDESGDTVNEYLKEASKLSSGKGAVKDQIDQLQKLTKVMKEHKEGLDKMVKTYKDYQKELDTLKKKAKDTSKDTEDYKKKVKDLNEELKKQENVYKAASTQLGKLDGVIHITEEAVKKLTGQTKKTTDEMKGLGKGAKDTATNLDIETAATKKATTSTGQFGAELQKTGLEQAALVVVVQQGINVLRTWGQQITQSATQLGKLDGVIHITEEAASPRS